MGVNKYLDTSTTSISELYDSPQMVVTIDGYEYTAITSRSYSFKTTTPTKIVGNGFDYSKHSTVQPMDVSYTIVVSKIDMSEYNKLVSLLNNRILFKLTSMIYNAPSCLITQIKISDENFDTFILSVDIKEINTSILTSSSTSTNMSIQIFSDENADGSAYDLETTSEIQSPENPDQDYYEETIGDVLITMLVLGPIWTGMYAATHVSPYIVSTINDISTLVKSDNIYNSNINNMSKYSMLIEKNRVLQLGKDYSSVE